MDRLLITRSRWRYFIQSWQDIDWFLLLLVAALTGLGGIVIRSTQLNSVLTDYWWQHWLGGGIGILIAVAIARFHYEHLRRWHWLIYGFVNLSLLAVRFVGTEALGAQRWINIAGFNFQPSEFAKLGVIATLAALLQTQTATTFPSLIRALAATALPLLLVFLQPDLGTSLVFGAITLGMLYWANANLGWILLLISPLVSAILFGIGVADLSEIDALSLPGVQLGSQFGVELSINVFLLVWLVWVMLMGLTGWRTLPWSWSGALGALTLNLISGGLGQFFWGLLKDYQQDRLILFLDPDRDPLGGGYHLIQSRIAIGAGELWGRGLSQGTQTQLGFIPEQHTDFIFSAIGEELGLVGCLTVLLVFWLICLRLVLIAQSAKDNFGSLIAIGVLSMLVFQVVINVGMTIGLAPITGIPLPWLSYGRSALLTNFLAIGLVESVASHRFQRSKF